MIKVFRTGPMLALMAAALLSACAQAPREAPQIGFTGAGMGASNARAAGYLNVGDAARARTELLATLANHPRDPVARKLLAQVDADPELLLGSNKYPYRTRPGETLAVLSERFLGDRLMFYALARYNRIETPGAPLTGRVLLIPVSTPQAVAAAVARWRAPQLAPTAGRDSDRADQLRNSALGELSGGAVDRAVSLLREAQALDPDNPVIQDDLNRATRIRNTVRHTS